MNSPLLSNGQFIPINIDIKNPSAKLLTGKRLIVAVVLFVISLSITIFIINKTIIHPTSNDANPPKVDILSGLLLILINSSIFYILVFKVCLREKMLLSYYKNIIQMKNSPTYKLFKVVNIDKSAGAPILMMANGYRMMGIKLYSDSIIGKNTKDDIESHYTALRDMLNRLTINFPFVWHETLTNRHGYDNRWEHLIDVNSNNPLPTIKQAVNAVILYNQRIRSNLCSDYFIVAEQSFIRSATQMVEELTLCAKAAEDAKYSGWDFIDEDIMTEISAQLFGSEKSFKELMETVNNDNKFRQLVWITKIYKTDGTISDRGGIFK